MEEYPPGYSQRYGVRLPDGDMAVDPYRQVWMFEDRQRAEDLIHHLRTVAEKLGMSDWHGQVVRQLATPWISDDDNAALMVTELSAWLARQVGGES